MASLDDLLDEVLQAAELSPEDKRTSRLFDGLRPSDDEAERDSLASKQESDLPPAQASSVWTADTLEFADPFADDEPHRAPAPGGGAAAMAGAGSRTPALSDHPLAGVLHASGASFEAHVRLMQRAECDGAAMRALLLDLAKRVGAAREHLADDPRTCAAGDAAVVRLGDAVAYGKLIERYPNAEFNAALEALLDVVMGGLATLCLAPSVAAPSAAAPSAVVPSAAAPSAGEPAAIGATATLGALAQAVLVAVRGVVAAPQDADTVLALVTAVRQLTGACERLGVAEAVRPRLVTLVEALRSAVAAARTPEPDLVAEHCKAVAVAAVALVRAMQQPSI